MGASLKKINCPVKNSFFSKKGGFLVIKRLFLSLGLSGFVFFLVLNFVPKDVLAWTEPSVSPPGGNVAAPLNTSGTGQTKTGGLNILGNIGVRTPSPYGALEVTPENKSWGEGIVINPSPVGYSAVFLRKEGTSGSTKDGSWALGKNAALPPEGWNGGELFQITREGLLGGSLYRVDAPFQIKTTGESLFGFNVGIGNTMPGARLTIGNNLAHPDPDGSSGDAIYAYTNSANAAISAEQGGSGWAGYFSGKVFASQICLGGETDCTTSWGSGIITPNIILVPKNLVTNGGMEGDYSDGVAPGWAKGSVITSASLDSHTGTKSQRISKTEINDGNRYDSFYQNLTSVISPEKKYLLSFWAKGNSGPHENLKVRIAKGTNLGNAPNGLDTSIDLSGSYQRYSFPPFAVGNDDSYLQFGAYQQPFDVLVDDISLIEVDSAGNPALNNPAFTVTTDGQLRGTEDVSLGMGGENVINGSFETGINPWFNWNDGSGPNHTGSSVEDTTAPSGAKVAQIVADGTGSIGYNAFKQATPLAVGKTYKITYYAKSMNGETPTTISFGVQQQADNQYDQEITSSWRQYTVFHTVTSIYQNIGFFSISGPSPSIFEIDAVSIKEVGGGLYVNSASGNVGIGTTAPLVKFHVTGITGGIGDLAYFESTDANAPLVQIYRRNNNSNLSNGDKVGSLHFGGYFGGTYNPTAQEIARISGYYLGDETTRVGALAFETSNGVAPVEAMRINNLGNVGIGTPTPGAKLEIFQTSGSDTAGDNQAIRLGYNGLFGFRSSADGMTLNIDRYSVGWQTPLMSMRRDNGKVGIGTTTPGAKLTIGDNPNQNPDGSSGDAIYAYADSTNAAISAEQANANGWAGYFSGNVNITNPTSNSQLCLNGVCKTAWPVSGGGASYWTLSGSNLLYPNQTNYSVAIGGTSSSAPFYFDAGSKTLRLGGPLQVAANSGQLAITGESELVLISPPGRCNNNGVCEPPENPQICPFDCLKRELDIPFTSAPSNNLVDQAQAASFIPSAQAGPAPEDKIYVQGGNLRIDDAGGANTMILLNSDGSASFSNNVGIGTTPQDLTAFGSADLTVNGGVRAGVFYDDTYATTGYYADLNVGGKLGGNWTIDGNATLQGSVQAGTGSGYGVKLSTGTAADIQSWGSKPLFIQNTTQNTYINAQSGGQVTIGTDTPDSGGAKLTVNGGVKAGVFYDDITGYYADLNVGGNLGGNWTIGGNIYSYTNGGAFETRFGRNSGEYLTIEGDDINYSIISKNDADENNNHNLAFKNFAGGTGNQSISFWTKNNGAETEAIKIDGSGNVGIGTMKPAGKLNVAGDVTNPVVPPEPMQPYCPSGYDWYNEDGDATIDNGECKRTGLAVMSSGNVGIGNATPGAKLTIGNNPNHQDPDGSAGDAIYTYTDSADAAISAENPTGYAGYFSGKAYITGDVGIGTPPQGGRARLIVGTTGRAIDASSDNEYAGYFSGASGKVYISGRVGIGVEPSDTGAKLSVCNSGFAGAGIYSNCNTNTGVYGQGTNYGIKGQVYATDAVGVYGESNISATGYGVLGRAVGGYGVYGEATNSSGINYGVYGKTSSASGYAGYFEGNVNITGSINTAPSGTWCGLCVDGTANAFACMGLSICGNNPCPSGWSKILSMTVAGVAGTPDYICRKN